MKKINKQTWLLVGLGALLLLMTILLAMCNGKAEDDDPEDTSVSTSTVTEPTQKITEPTERTEPTEMPTEVTEPVTEPATEPATEPPSGNTRPGGGPGSGKPSGGDDEDEEEEEEEEEEEKVEIGAPGTAGNPYMEDYLEFPASAESVNIPKNAVVSYAIYGSDELIVTVENPDAYIIYKDKTYQADEEGVITVTVAAAAADAPVEFQIGNNGTEASFEMHFAEPLGGKSNPEILESLEKIEAKLAEGDGSGYYYRWLAEETGDLTLRLDEINPEDTPVEIVVTIGDETVKLSDMEDGVLAVAVKKGEPVDIQIIAVADSEGEIPAVVVEFSGELTPAKGSESDPYEYRGTFPMITERIEAGDGIYYLVYDVSGRALIIEDQDACIVYKGVTYQPDAQGVVKVELDYEEPALVQIVNNGETDESYSISLGDPLGAKENPEQIIELNTLSAVIKQGNSNGYYYSWNAPESGTLSIAVTGVNPESVAYDVVATNGEKSWSLSDTADKRLSLAVSQNDTVRIQVFVKPDAAGKYPGATVSLTGTFTTEPGTEGNPYPISVSTLPTTFETVVIQPDSAVYYSVANAKGSILTIDSADAYVIYDGVTYMAENGRVQLKLDETDPTVLQIGNSRETEMAFSLEFTAFMGTKENPYILEKSSDFKADITRYHDGSYYISYTAGEKGTLVIQPQSIFPDATEYDVHMTTTGMSSDLILSEDGVEGMLRMEAEQGDVITIQVTLPETNEGGYLTALLMLSAKFEAAI